MKHKVKVKVKVPVEKRGLLGFKKTVTETRVVEVDGKTYKRMQKEARERYLDGIEEMLLWDEIFDD